MERKDFLKKSILGIGTFVAVPVALSSCQKDDSNDCKTTPTEIAGPFPIKTPADLIKANIVGDRNGVPLLINLKIENVKDDCKLLEGVHVDLWQCDAKGNYSEYAGQQQGDFTNAHFLRGRQTTDVTGMVSFISIYPGWYPGRAPHLHVEILKDDGTSLLVTQIAFPEAISETVYGTNHYGAVMDTNNAEDGAFKDDVAQNMATITGNLTDGYTLTKTIKVKFK